MSGFFEACVNDWDEIVTSNWRFLTAFVFGAIMIIVSFFAAIGFCCSRYGKLSYKSFSAEASLPNLVLYVSDIVSTRFLSPMSQSFNLSVAK